MNHLVQLGFLAFLDLICCGFGAATLLFLLAAMAAPAHPTTIDDESLLVRCLHEEGQKAEIGIEFQAPGETTWKRGHDEAGRYGLYSVASGPDSGSEAFLIVFTPEKGTWRFRPFLVDFPAKSDGEGTRVKVKIFGKHKDPDDGKGEWMRYPGDAGQIVSVLVAAN